MHLGLPVAHHEVEREGIAIGRTPTSFLGERGWEWMKVKLDLLVKGDSCHKFMVMSVQCIEEGDLCDIVLVLRLSWRLLVAIVGII